MKLRGILLLAFSLLLGLVVAGWVRHINRADSASAQSRQVVVAATQLNFGDRISTRDLNLVDWPNSAVPQGSFMTITDAAGDGDRVALRSIEIGEPVLASKISGKGGRATLSALIDKDMRAVTIRVTDATAVAGFVLPNDRVDVLLTRSAANRDVPQSETLLQNVRVLAVDQDANEQKDKPVVVKAVTLEVSPDDAQKLTLGATVGMLSLSLRNATNPDPTPTRVLSLEDLSTRTTPAEGQAKPALESHPNIVIYRGTNATTYDVERDGGVAPSTNRTRPNPASAQKPGSR